MNNITPFIYRLNLIRLERKGSNFVSECPICKEGKSAGRKQRFHILFDGKKTTCYCFNCGISTSFTKFLQEYYPDIYNEYKRDIFFKKDDFFMLTPEKKVEPVKDILDGLIPVRKSKVAIDYMLSRKLPKMLLDYTYYTDNFMKFVSDKGLKEYKFIPKRDERIVFPVTNSGRVCYLQGRAVYDTEYRYINVKVDDGVKLFNYDGIDWGKRVFITEGILDCSYFLPQSGAMLNSSIDIELFSRYKDHAVILLDNDMKSNEFVYKKVCKFAEAGYKIVILPDEVKEKDINEMVMNGWGKNEIMDVINKNTYQGVMAKVKLKLV